ncbi:acyl dehydratase [Aestuariirhabdus sp. Z084]|uniref:MaoC family dehydratase n=1 Tax=Aestuariirhabdus haliotis TaxID=2918751 RepID=UPI00201B3900|nr:MaoC/PaaZ C-terminal domain-containing protein [Aestuariirhabdus haliotis]MCL6416568.1 acyl dehydratase [Aestuariirhabdus haliotis]MCL6420565.1 acyl dehydratase [Aestuariirhabdus haliotis]
MLLASMPSLAPLFARALLARGKKGALPSSMPEGRIRVEDVRIDSSHLHNYRTLVGAPESTVAAGGASLPICYPHLLSFPLQLKLLVAPDFPLPLLGLVHLRNRIRLLGQLDVHQPLAIECWLGEQRSTERGLEFDLWTQVEQQGQPLWQSCSVNLYRQGSAGETSTGSSTRASQRRPVSPLATTECWSLAANLGWLYARSAGDFNPIHLHPLSAKLFGFPRAIIHGMWSKARCLSRLQPLLDSLGTKLEIECDFKTPVFLPGQVLMSWQEEGEAGIAFLLQDGEGVKPHLQGRVRSLADPLMDAV